MSTWAQTQRPSAGTRFLRIVGALLLFLFVFDLVDGSTPFTPEGASGSPAHGSPRGGTGGNDVSPDAEFLCARCLVVVPTLPSDPRSHRALLVGVRTESGLARGFVASPFHPPRDARR